MKVIFLDIDGVLNNESQIVELVNLLGREQYSQLIRDLGEIPFDYRCCNLLQELIKETSAEVILSSTWRLSAELIKGIEKYAGIKIKDITPRLTSNIRGEEIQQYLDNHKEITNYVILDDDSDMLKEQLGNFIKVNNKLGFTITEYFLCKNILEKEGE